MKPKLSNYYVNKEGKLILNNLKHLPPKIVLGFESIPVPSLIDPNNLIYALIK